MNRRNIIFVSLFSLIFLFCLTGFKGQKSTAQDTTFQQNLVEFKPVSVTILVKAKGDLLYYKKTSTYSKSDFEKITKSVNKISAGVIKNFKNYLQKYSKEALNCNYKLDKLKNSTILSCDIKGAMYSARSYDFHWLLAKFPFDLYKFNQKEKELNFYGKVNGISTTIMLIFDFPIAHCHEHVWPVQ